MPNNIHKSAAVPFVNQKGERSMKRVKVERYVAGKKPAYAKEDDEDEYYTTDDEEDNDEEQESVGGQQSDEQDEESSGSSPRRKIRDQEDSDSDTQEKPETAVQVKSKQIDEDEEDFDDPRFRRLKQLEAKPSTSRIEDPTSRIISRVDSSNIIVEDEEDELETRQRHALARARQIEEPVGPQAVFGDVADQQLDPRETESGERLKRIQTDDILKDFELTLDEPKSNTVDPAAEERMKDMLEQARQEAIFKAQIHKKIEEDNKRELEKEMLIKGGFNAHDMESVKTDDEDEELAYEEWKLREIKRVLRDRSERAVQVRGKA